MAHEGFSNIFECKRGDGNVEERVFEGLKYLISYPEGFQEDRKYPLVIFFARCRNPKRNNGSPAAKSLRSESPKTSGCKGLYSPCPSLPERKLVRMDGGLGPFGGNFP